MLRLIVGLLLIISAGFSCASPDISGSWIQDVDAQVKFNTKKTKLSKDELEEMSCLPEKMTFADGILTVSIDEGSCIVNGVPKIMYPYSEKRYYKVVAVDGEVLVLKESDAEGEHSHLSSIYFVNDDMMWIYNFGKNASDDVHERLYFKRVGKSKIDAGSIKK